MKRKTVVIAYKFMPQYRIDFFDQLKTKLGEHNVELIITYGKLHNSDRNDEMVLDWAIYRQNIIFKFFGFVIYWQPVTDIVKRKDLVIVEQANSLLLNYYLLILRSFTKTKFAFWGHGRNRQGRKESLYNSFKRFFITRCDHWFAYTSSVKEYLISNNYDEHKITVVNNSFDTLKLQSLYHAITHEQTAILKKELGIEENDCVGIYCGGLYKEKRLDFLLESAVMVKQRNRKFHLIILGAGPDADLIKQAASTNNWIHYAGPRFDQEKALYFKLADVFLMPGAVGLAVLDSFALQVPMIIPGLQTHGPEIDYMHHNENCIVTKDEVGDFAAQAIYVLSDSSKRDELKRGCAESAAKITVEAMVQNFTKGVITCLKR